MEEKDLLNCSPGELVDMGICPTCFNREHDATKVAQMRALIESENR